ncbi:universal stress protein [Telmatocola sphagniphila]|uniref:Universal stress protein n=1 Tax=Telmatocola sphagniphila TaxID=1123043 RepID=A0A8E6EV93_9BACT|nr:universal stress protein [Telmatocola sphagniphila]QVL32425.1 universal stress protein [Telmatocola sphagniphila]
MFQILRILYATDFSSYSNQAYFHAVAIAERTGAELVICHVYQPKQGRDSEYWREQLEQIRPNNAAIPIQHVLLEGDPADEIVRYATEANMNMLVIGTHGRSGVDRLMMGSVAERILRDSPCSVLVVKLPKGVSTPIRTQRETATAH